MQVLRLIRCYIESSATGCTGVLQLLAHNVQSHPQCLLVCFAARSWGANWGEQGYGRVQMTGDGPGACGMYRVSFLPSPLRGSKKALNG